MDLAAHLPRVRLGTLPTPLERGPLLPGGARLWVKRDDLTGLGMGGNKVRKLELLCGAALAEGATCLVTVGAGQSNHCRATAAAGAVLGLPVHLVLGGHPPPQLTGNQLLSALFDATLHFTGTDDWDLLEAVRERMVVELRDSGERPYSIPIGGSTPLGAVGFALAHAELMDQTRVAGVTPRAVVHATSSGGTHAGLVAGRALARAEGAVVGELVPVGVAKGVLADPGRVRELARDCLSLLGRPGAPIADGDISVVSGLMGADYAAPTAEADAAIIAAARFGGWVLDRVYTGKAFAGLLALAA
ncbi:MAG TPA: pyridoxal-phosphate dependent enzyme, partial [Acidimicrobiales bacterium]